jgi:hypothetical protein
VVFGEIQTQFSNRMSGSKLAGKFQTLPDAFAEFSLLNHKHIQQFSF